MKIAVIGGAGFIGSHVTQQLLAAGHDVTVTASKPEDTARYAHLKKFPGADTRLRMYPLDLLDARAIPGFLYEHPYVVHAGTPFQLGFVDPMKELIDPTVIGTQNLLKAVAGSPRMEKLVIVASVAAHNTHFPMDVPGREGVTTEESKPFFSEEDHPYAQGKFMADQAVRNFLKDYKGKCQLVTVSPVGVFGKPLSDREDSTSVGLQYLFKNKIAPDPFVQMMFDTDLRFAIVGVADVARAIVKAMEVPGLHGKHFLLSSESYPVSDLSRMLNGEAPVNEPTTVYDAGASERELGMVYEPVEQFLG